MARVLVMIPSGEVYDHDCVRWYNYQDVQKSINHYHNIGDAFVFDSSLKLMNYDMFPWEYFAVMRLVCMQFVDITQVHAVVVKESMM